MSNNSSALRVTGDFLLRALVLFGLLGLPLLFAEWLEWWSAEGWFRTALTVWLFVYGLGLFVIAVGGIVGALLIAVVLVDLWISLFLGALGIRLAMRHFHETRSRVADLLIAFGNALRSANFAFPLDDHRSRGGL